MKKHLTNETWETKTVRVLTTNIIIILYKIIMI